MKIRLTADELRQIAEAGISIERYAAGLSETVAEIVAAITRCTITDPALVDPDFAPDGTVDGTDWLELHDFPMPKEQGT